MKTKMQILRLSAGVIEGNTYASVTIIDDSIADLKTAERIDVGQQHAKVRLDTSNNNALALRLADSGLIPGLVDVELKSSVRAGEASIQIINFYSSKKVD